MSLVATRLQNWRIENPELDRNMTRPCEYGALDFFIEQTNAPSSIINPNLRDRAFASIGNMVQVPLSITTAMYRLAMSVRALSLTMKIRPHW